MTIEAELHPNSPHVTYRSFPSTFVVSDYWAQHPPKGEECVWNKFILCLRTPNILFSQWLPFESANYALHNRRCNFSALAVTHDNKYLTIICMTRDEKQIPYRNISMNEIGASWKQRGKCCPWRQCISPFESSNYAQWTRRCNFSGFYLLWEAM